jgi:hypothetical protein
LFKSKTKRFQNYICLDFKIKFEHSNFPVSSPCDSIPEDAANSPTTLIHPDPAKSGSDQQDSAKSDSDQQDSVKSDSDQQDSVKSDSDLQDSAKPDSDKSDLDQQGSAKSDSDHPDSAKSDSDQPDSDMQDETNGGIASSGLKEKSSETTSMSDDANDQNVDSEKCDVTMAEAAVAEAAVAEAAVAEAAVGGLAQGPDRVSPPEPAAAAGHVEPGIDFTKLHFGPKNVVDKFSSSNFWTNFHLKTT